MKDIAGARSSAYYQRAFRDRLREAGLVKKEIWIRPEFAAELAAIEKRMRKPLDSTGPKVDADTQDGGWTITSLYRALAETRPVRANEIEVEWMEGAEPSLYLVMHEFGELPVFIAVAGDRIIVEALMWPADQVADPADFNAHVLSTHKLLPLSTMGIEAIGGTPCYIMFGSLDAHSSLVNVMFEIETLADNVIAATEAYRPFLRVDADLPPPAIAPAIAPAIS